MDSLCILGKRGAGKTFFIQHFTAFLNQKENNNSCAGFVPFEKNLSLKNKTELDLDSDVLYRLTDSALHVNHCGLYAFYNNYPAVFSAQCEGLRIKRKLFLERVKFLNNHYQTLLIEYGESVFLPLFEKNETFASFLAKDQIQFIYIINSDPEKFEAALGDMHYLSSIDIHGCVIINNHPNSTDVKWYEFIWKTINEKVGYDVVGILPFLRNSSYLDSKFLTVFNEVNNWIQLRESKGSKAD